jgi:hypothetical protein
MALLVCWDVCWFDGFSTIVETKGKSQVLKIAPTDGSNTRHFNAHFRLYYH